MLFFISILNIFLYNKKHKALYIFIQKDFYSGCVALFKILIASYTIRIIGLELIRLETIGLNMIWLEIIVNHF